MKYHGFAAGLIIAMMICPIGAIAAVHVDTSGNILKEEDVGLHCRPTETLGDGRIMVFSTSEADLRLLRAHMIASGITDETTLEKWQAMAANNDCTNRAGLNCSAGSCPSGTCKEETVNGYKGCACK